MCIRDRYRHCVVGMLLLLLQLMRRRRRRGSVRQLPALSGRSRRRRRRRAAVHWRRHRHRAAAGEDGGDGGDARPAPQRRDRRRRLGAAVVAPRPDVDDGELDERRKREDEARRHPDVDRLDVRHARQLRLTHSQHPHTASSRRAPRVCPRSKRKTASTINIKLSTHIAYSMTGSQHALGLPLRSNPDF